MILCNVKFHVYCLYVCFVSCARVWRRTEFEILSTQIKKKGKSVDNSKASHPVSTQRQKTNNYCPRDNCRFNRSAYCRRGSRNKSTTINNNANTRYKKCLLNSSSGSHQDSQRAATSFFRRKYLWQPYGIQTVDQ